jgi:hypothetical protein
MDYLKLIKQISLYEKQRKKIEEIKLLCQDGEKYKHDENLSALYYCGMLNMKRTLDSLEVKLKSF